MSQPSSTAAPVAGVFGEHLVLTVQLPDRPGALGAVASRIGAVGANITDVSVTRSEAEAVDVFHITFPGDEQGLDLLGLLVGLLVAEIHEVDGAAVRDWQRITAPCCQ